MSERTIYYECPDWDGPTGGILCIYRHVEMLSRHRPACVLHRRPGFRPGWFASDAPVRYREEGAGPRDGDVLVLPEGFFGRMRDTAQAGYERVVFAQNWAYVFGCLPPGEDWRDYGIRHVLSVSRYIRDFLAASMGLPSEVVHPSVDTALFRADGAKRLQVACMPRKNPKDLQQIEGIFRSRWPQYRSVPFVPVDGAPHERVAEVLAESAVFLATGYPEGCPLPPLEAMASECLVVGFSGRGGREYMRHRRNCLLAEDGDVLTAAAHLAAAVQMAETDAGAAMRHEARRTAERFAPPRVEASLVRAYRRLLGEDVG